MSDIPTTSQQIGELRAKSWQTVPIKSGIYWWYFPESCLTSFQITEHSNISHLNFQTNINGKVCLYVGIAKSLKQRVRWHAEQPLKQSALKSGFLSTFRNTLLALNNFDYNEGFDEINQFMDCLDITWRETDNKQEAEELEHLALNSNTHFPLNIQGNKKPELKEFTRFLKLQRKEYKNRYLIN